MNHALDNFHKVGFDLLVDLIPELCFGLQHHLQEYHTLDKPIPHLAAYHIYYKMTY